MSIGVPRARVKNVEGKCDKEIITVTVTGNFYPNRFYSCRIATDRMTVFQTNFTSATARDLIKCLFLMNSVPTSQLPERYFHIVQVYESISPTGENAVKVDGEYPTYVWGVDKCFPYPHWDFIVKPVVVVTVVLLLACLAALLYSATPSPVLVPATMSYVLLLAIAIVLGLHLVDRGLHPTAPPLPLLPPPPPLPSPPQNLSIEPQMWLLSIWFFDQCPESPSVFLASVASPSVYVTYYAPCALPTSVGVIVLASSAAKDDQWQALSNTMHEVQFSPALSGSLDYGPANK